MNLRMLMANGVGLVMVLGFSANLHAMGSQAPQPSPSSTAAPVSLAPLAGLAGTFKLASQTAGAYEDDATFTISGSSDADLVISKLSKSASPSDPNGRVTVYKNINQGPYHVSFKSGCDDLVVTTFDGKRLVQTMQGNCSGFGYDGIPLPWHTNQYQEEVIELNADGYKSCTASNTGPVPSGDAARPLLCDSPANGTNVVNNQWLRK